MQIGFEYKHRDDKKKMISLYLQAVIGGWIFGEAISAVWWLGTAFVTLGLVFISLGNDETTVEGTVESTDTKKTS